MSRLQSDSLCAVLLCVRTRSGAKILYNTSEEAAVDSATPANGHAEQSIHAGPAHLDVAQHVAVTTTQERASHPVETTLGLKTDVLQKLLCPGRWSNEQRIQVTIDKITFIGEPCFAVDGEIWSNERPSAESTQGTAKSPTIEIKEPEAPKQAVRDFTHVADSFDSRLSGQSLATSMDSASTRSGAAIEGLQMFNVVIATRQGSSTAPVPGLRSDTIYEELCKPLTKALQHLQAQSRYVELQCRKITLARTKSRSNITIQNAIQHESELAWALSELHRCIVLGDIATFRLQGMEMSLQLPTPDSTLPHEHSALNSALLLLEDKVKLLKDLNTTSETAAISYFITHLTPSKPLSKLATKLALPPEAILFLAEHLIKWRKAKLIDPLHVRNTYVVDPAARLRDLSRLTLAYGNRFPAIQSLPKMLSMLGGGKLAPYASYIPSKVHKETYMDILAWLTQHKLVFRVRTVGWLLLRVRSADGEDSSAEDESGGDDGSSTISDSGTAFRPDEHHLVETTEAKRLLDPRAMSVRQQSAVLALRHSLGSDDEMQDTFTRLVKYLDGGCPLEDVAVLEGMKRSKLEACLDKLKEMECLQTFQYAQCSHDP